MVNVFNALKRLKAVLNAHSITLKGIVHNAKLGITLAKANVIRAQAI